MSNVFLKALELYANSGTAQIAEYIGYIAISIVCAVLILGLFDSHS